MMSILYSSFGGDITILEGGNFIDQEPVSRTLDVGVLFGDSHNAEKSWETSLPLQLCLGEPFTQSH